MPRGWKDSIALIAYVFHTQPSELWEFELDDLKFWLERADWITEKMVPRGR